MTLNDASIARLVFGFMFNRMNAVKSMYDTNQNEPGKILEITTEGTNYEENIDYEDNNRKMACKGSNETVQVKSKRFSVECRESFSPTRCKTRSFVFESSKKQPTPQ